MERSKLKKIICDQQLNHNKLRYSHLRVQFQQALLIFMSESNNAPVSFLNSNDLTTDQGLELKYQNHILDLIRVDKKRLEWFFWYFEFVRLRSLDLIDTKTNDISSTMEIASASRTPHVKLDAELDWVKKDSKFPFYLEKFKTFKGLSEPVIKKIEAILEAHKGERYTDFYDMLNEFWKDFRDDFRRLMVSFIAPELVEKNKIPKWWHCGAVSFAKASQNKQSGKEVTSDTVEPLYQPEVRLPSSPNPQYHHALLMDPIASPNGKDLMDIDTIVSPLGISGEDELWEQQMFFDLDLHDPSIDQGLIEAALNIDDYFGKNAKLIKI